MMISKPKVWTNGWLRPVAGDLDLSQNFLDESAGALELLTLFVDHPKYGPKDRPKVAESWAKAGKVNRCFFSWT